MPGLGTSLELVPTHACSVHGAPISPFPCPQPMRISTSCRGGCIACGSRAARDPVCTYLSSVGCCRLPSVRLCWLSPVRLSRPGCSSNAASCRRAGSPWQDQLARLEAASTDKGYAPAAPPSLNLSAAGAIAVVKCQACSACGTSTAHLKLCSACKVRSPSLHRLAAASRCMLAADPSSLVSSHSPAFVRPAGSGLLLRRVPEIPLESC